MWPYRLVNGQAFPNCKESARGWPSRSSRWTDGTGKEKWCWADMCTLSFLVGCYYLREWMTKHGDDWTATFKFSCTLRCTFFPPAGFLCMEGNAFEVAVLLSWDVYLYSFVVYITLNLFTSNHKEPCLEETKVQRCIVNVLCYDILGVPL